jgi:outer membrane protein insertion porin family
LGELAFKGNEKIISEYLSEIVPLNQKPNNKPLNLPWIQFTPRVWFYNFGQNRFSLPKHEAKLIEARNRLASFPENYTNDAKTERKKQKTQRAIKRYQENIIEQNGWFWRNIGEAQTVINRKGMVETSARIQKFYHDTGFRDATVNYSIDSISLLATDKIKVTYLINEGTKYIIDTVMYEVEDPVLDSLLEAHANKRAIKPGDAFDYRLVEAEKNRIEQLTKEYGYYNFINRFIIHEAFNATYDLKKFEEEKHGNLRFRILNPPNQDGHRSYKIAKVVFKGFDPYANPDATQADTLMLNSVEYITVNSNIPIPLLDKKIITRPDQLYNISNITETQRQISLLNQFAFASSQISPVNEQEVSLEYFVPQLQKYSFNTGPGINHVYNGNTGFLGFGVPVTLTARNLMKRLDVFEASGRIFREGQPSPLGNTDLNSSWEIGTNLSLTFPNISIFGKDIERLRLKNPRSQIGGGFNYSEPYWGSRLNFRLNNNYRWQPNKYSTVFFSFLDANLINTNYNLSDPAGKAFYENLVSEEQRGNNLKTTFDPQFVSSFNGSYVYNDQNLQNPYASSRFLRIFVESGGTMLNFARNKDRIPFIESLFPLRSDINSPDSVRKYFRFVKINVDYRQYINLTPGSSLAYRFNVGVANPYGNKSLPYEKNFFVGGSNSIRAWSPRSLGVGSAFPDTASNYIIPQAGDILLEGSFEWRKKVARFFGDIQFAVFIDAGNIWKWYQINTPEKYNKANFDFRRFYKEIAVGTGFGLRYDLSYFQFRFDWGIKVVDPSRPEGDRFVLDEFKLRRRLTDAEGKTYNNPYRLIFNLGIGYPF